MEKTQLSTPAQDDSRKRRRVSVADMADTCLPCTLDDLVALVRPRTDGCDWAVPLDDWMMPSTKMPRCPKKKYAVLWTHLSAIPAEELRRKLAEVPQKSLIVAMRKGDRRQFIGVTPRCRDRQARKLGNKQKGNKQKGNKQARGTKGDDTTTGAVRKVYRKTLCKKLDITAHHRRRVGRMAGNAHFAAVIYEVDDVAVCDGEGDGAVYDWRLVREAALGWEPVQPVQFKNPARRHIRQAIGLSKGRWRRLARRPCQHVDGMTYGKVDDVINQEWASSWLNDAMEAVEKARDRAFEEWVAEKERCCDDEDDEIDLPDVSSTPSCFYDSRCGQNAVGFMLTYLLMQHRSL